MTEALVPGGGGVGGIAWITGLLAGLADADRDVTAVDLIVGTSAGSTVAAQLDSGLSLDELYARPVHPALQVPEIMAEVDLVRFGAQVAELLRDAETVPEMRRAAGGFALAAATVPESERRAAIGPNPLDPATRRPAADAGRAQGRGLTIAWSLT